MSDKIGAVGLDSSRGRERRPCSEFEFATLPAVTLREYRDAAIEELDRRADRVADPWLDVPEIAGVALPFDETITHEERVERCAELIGRQGTLMLRAYRDAAIRVLERQMLGCSARG